MSAQKAAVDMRLAEIIGEADFHRGLGVSTASIAVVVLAFVVAVELLQMDEVARSQRFAEVLAPTRDSIPASPSGQQATDKASCSVSLACDRHSYHLMRLDMVSNWGLLISENMQVPKSNECS